MGGSLLSGFITAVISSHKVLKLLSEDRYSRNFTVCVSQFQKWSSPSPRTNPRVFDFLRKVWWNLSVKYSNSRGDTKGHVPHFLDKQVTNCEVISLQISRQFLNQSELKSKPIMTGLHAFSRAFERCACKLIQKDGHVIERVYHRQEKLNTPLLDDREMIQSGFHNIFIRVVYCVVLSP